MATIPRMFRRGAGARFGVLLVGTLTALWLAMACLPVAAQAKVEEVLTKAGGPNVKVGLQPREAAFYTSGTEKHNGQGKLEVTPNLAASSFANASGNEVVHSANTYAIYWDPQDFYHGDWESLIDGFLANQSNAGFQRGSVFSLDTQYTDKSNKPAAGYTTFRGAYTDTHPYPETANCTDPRPLKFGIPLLAGTETTVCLTAAQIQTELQRFITQREEEHVILPKGMGTIFYMLTPPGVTACLNQGGTAPGAHCSDFNGTAGEISQYEEALTLYRQKKAKDEAESKPDAETEPAEPSGLATYKTSFCSYHSVVGSGASAILYAAIPWTAGGDGDGALAGVDRQGGFACQDGGFEPGGKANGEVQEKEREKEETPLEKEEFENKDKQEKREEMEAKEEGLAKPHDQEPNQLGNAVGPDGFHDEGLADLIINQVAVEQQDIVTDPLLNGWQDSQGKEVTDECRNFFVPDVTGSPTGNPFTTAGTLANDVLGPKSYYLNSGFNLAGTRRLHSGTEFPGLPFPGIECPTGVRLEPKFTAPERVKGGEVVGFNGMESTITLNSAVAFSPTGTPQPNYAIYTWNFGDETPEVSGYAPGAPACEPTPWLSPCAAAVFHSFQYNGTYNVTLRVKDVAGDEEVVSEPLTVVEGENRPVPPPPPPAGGGGSGSSGGSSGSSTPAAGGGGTSSAPAPAAPKAVVAPVATAAISATSLKTALNKGLTIRYSVSEQVTGHFEVLLAASIAKKIGLKGPLATGLPKGTPPQIIVAKAILVTTKGGRNSVKIQFGKKTAKLLHKLHKVPLMVRLIVHNGLSNSPAATTTVVSAITLTH